MRGSPKSLGFTLGGHKCNEKMLNVKFMSSHPIVKVLVKQTDDKHADTAIPAVDSHH